MELDEYRLLTGFPLERAIAFDLETTGLDSDRDEILSIAVVDSYGNALFSSLIRPTRTRSWPEAQAVNHISPSMVRGAPTIAQCRKQLRDLFTTDRLLVTYNGRFDIGFLVSAGIIDSPWEYEEFDVMREYARVHGSERWSDSGKYKCSKLVQCASSYGCRFGAHDALNDARATMYCFKALIHDRDYVDEAFRRRCDRSRAAGTSHTKAHAEAIAAIMGDEKFMERDGKLVKHLLSNGPSKGQARYDVMVGGSVVGRLTKAGMNVATEFYSAIGDGLLPDRAPCYVRLYNSDGKYASRSFLALGDDATRELFERARTSYGEQRGSTRAMAPDDEAAAESRGGRLGTSSKLDKDTALILALRIVLVIGIPLVLFVSYISGLS